MVTDISQYIFKKQKQKKRKEKGMTSKMTSSLPQPRKLGIHSASKSPACTYLRKGWGGGQSSAALRSKTCICSHSCST